MRVFIAGTDTNIGKTLVASWLCLQTGSDYFKPIQTGSQEGRDSETVQRLAGCRVHKEAYVYQAAVAPYLAASLANETIELENIKWPWVPRLIVEGAGGLMVPINAVDMMVDLIQLPVILVASSRLGTINHTLLSLEALRGRKIKVLGVIMTGELNQANADAIATYGAATILAQIPFLTTITQASLRALPLTPALEAIFGVVKCV